MAFCLDYFSISPFVFFHSFSYPFNCAVHENSSWAFTPTVPCAWIVLVLVWGSQTSDSQRVKGDHPRATGRRDKSRLATHQAGLVVEQSRRRMAKRRRTDERSPYETTTPYSSDLCVRTPAHKNKLYSTRRRKVRKMFIPSSLLIHLMGDHPLYPCLLSVNRGIREEMSRSLRWKRPFRGSPGVKRLNHIVFSN